MILSAIRKTTCILGFRKLQSEAKNQSKRHGKEPKLVTAAIVFAFKQRNVSQ